MRPFIVLYTSHNLGTSDWVLLESLIASHDIGVYCLPVNVLDARLKKRPPGRTPEHLAHLDIGPFPSIPPASTPDIPKRPSGENFHFLKWVHRSNNSDLALVKLQNDADLKILKIVTFFIACAEVTTNTIIA